MPTKYKRKESTSRGRWSEESLKSAINAIKNDGMSVYAAASTYKIPRKTLERRYKQNNDKKGPMGPSSMFREENERRLATHIKLMQGKGFPLTIDDVRSIAYRFAEQLGLKHRFNKETQKAGYDWLHMFLSRNPDITLRKSEGVSLARTTAMNRSEVDEYFKLLERVLMQDDEMLAPNCIFNMDETGLQLNNRPGHVLAVKGSKTVPTVTSTEKGETITVIACCNAEGTYLPPACIMKGKNKKAEFEDGMPPGSKLFMSEKSVYINSDIFLRWLKTNFVPRKPAGKVVLLLDGHSTHCNSVEMLEYANQNGIILVFMPSHTSHYLQPLDRAVFRSLKTHFYEQCRLWLKQNVGRRITRLSFGTLLSKAWAKAASAENAISGFRSTGVYPFNPAAVPEYAFSEESTSIPPDTLNERASTGAVENVEDKDDAGTPNDCTTTAAVENLEDKDDDDDGQSCSGEPSRTVTHSPELVPKKCKTSFSTTSEVSGIMPRTLKTPPLINNVADFTPTRILKEIFPIPQKLLQVRKRAKQVGTLLTSDEHIKARKCAEE